MIGLDDLVATRLTTRILQPPAGFSLTAFWAEYVASTSNESH